MKVNLWVEENLTCATNFMFSHIDNSDYEIEHLIIVPDRFSLLAEKKLLSLLPGGILFNVRVTTFSNFAIDLLRKSGVNQEMLTAGERLLLVKKAAKEEQKEFLYFKKSNINFCNQIFKAISLLGSSRIFPEDINKMSFLSATSKNKFHDIALLYEKYLSLVGDNLDPASLFEQLLKYPSAKDYLAKTKIYFAQFDSFTSQMYEIIKFVVDGALETNISFASPKTIGNKYIYENDIKEKIIKICNENKYQIEVFEGNLKKSNGQESVLINLYSCQITPAVNVDDYFKSYSAFSKRQEVENIAKIIMSKIRKGNKFSDFAVAVGQLDDYKELIDEIFSKYEFNYFLDDSINAFQTLLARAVISLLNIKIHNYSKESLLNFYTNALLQTQDNKNIIEQIIQKQIDGKWKFDKFFSSVDNFSKYLYKFQEIKTFNQLIDMVKNFLNEIYPNYQKYLIFLHEKQLYKEENIEAQSFDIVSKTVQLIQNASSPNDEADFAELAKELELILSAKEISSVPTLVDGIMVGDATESFFEEGKNLFVIGGQNLPKIIGDNAILSDRDIENPICKKVVQPTSRMINRRNRFSLFNLLTQNWKSVAVSFQLLNDEGKINALPSFVEQLNQTFQTKTKQIAKIFTKESDLVDRIGCIANLKKYEILNSTKTEKNLQTKLFFKNNYVSVTQLETYFSCPFKHFVRYGLNLKEKEIFAFDQRDVGNICHKAVELFVNQYINKEFSFDYGIVDSFINLNFDKIIESQGLQKKLDLLCEKDGLVKFLKKQLKTILENVCREMQASCFRPYSLEEKVVANISENLNFIGKIDRIDVAEEYFRIIDYKTGKPKSLLKDLYYGNKLQLFLYAKVMQEKLNKHCGSVFYFDCKFDYEDSEGGKSLLKGLVEKDDENLKLFDKYLTEGAKSEILSIALSKSGSYTGNAISKMPLSFYQNYAWEVAKGACKEILEGFVKPMPDADACEHCVFGGICMYRKDSGIRLKTFRDFKEVNNGTDK